MTPTINITTDELELAVDEILDGVGEKLDDYFSINAKMTDDELLIFEALIARHVGLIVGFALIMVQTNIARPRESSNGNGHHNGKTGADVGDDVRYILVDVDKRLTDYIITMKLNDDEGLLLEAMIVKRIDKWSAEALLNVQRIACGLVPINMK